MVKEYRISIKAITARMIKMYLQPKCCKTYTPKSGAIAGESATSGMMVENILGVREEGYRSITKACQLTVAEVAPIACTSLKASNTSTLPVKNIPREAATNKDSPQIIALAFPYLSENGPQNN